MLVTLQLSLQYYNIEYRKPFNGPISYIKLIIYVYANNHKCANQTIPQSNSLIKPAI